MERYGWKKGVKLKLVDVPRDIKWADYDGVVLIKESDHQNAMEANEDRIKKFEKLPCPGCIGTFFGDCSLCNNTGSLKGFK